MRAMFGVLRDSEPLPGLAPQPGVAELGALAERIRATGLAVDLAIEGTPFPLGAAAGLTVYRIVQESLTNTIRHAAASRASVTIGYDTPRVHLRVSDDGTASAAAGPEGQQGHGIEGMRERAALHGGALVAGPAPGGGWAVSVTLRCAGASGDRAPGDRAPGDRAPGDRAPGDRANGAAG
jgi:signal transduction histidine kinase